MEPNWGEIQEQLAAIKAQLGGLYAEDADAEMKTCRAYSNQLLLDGTALTTNDTSADDKRDIIADMHQAVHKLQEQLDAIKTKSAETYRSHIGTEEKEAFEKLSPELQQQYNSLAYRSFAAFHVADQLLGKLSHLNAALTDASTELDRSMRPNEEARQTTGAGDVPTYDRDPALYTPGGTRPG